MLSWGIIGYGRIAKRFAKSLSYSDEGRLCAVASKTAYQKGSIEDYPNVKIYGSYDEIIDDEDIDAVYIALRHADHFEWAKKALLCNKVVLCEKPATLTYAQTKELCDLSRENHAFFMEAMKSRFVPMSQEIKSVCERGTIGEIQRIETSFCYDIDYDSESYLFDPIQGGALYDVGIYNISWVLDLIHSPIVDVQVHCERKYGVDVYDSVELTFESGQTALLEMGIDREKEKTMVIYGNLGEVHTTPFYRPVEATVKFDEEESFSASIPYEYDDFYGEIKEVHHCVGYIRYESERMSHQDSLDCIALIERIKELSHD